jgi:hypothetical protein
MSNINQLSNEYQNLAALAEQFNKAILVLKKEYLLSDEESKKKYPTLRLTDTERKNAHDFSEKMLVYLNERQPFMKAISRKIAQDDLINLQKTLALENTLNEDDLEKLDIVLFSLDEERSVLFRKLRMSRI